MISRKYACFDREVTGTRLDPTTPFRETGHRTSTIWLISSLASVERPEFRLGGLGESRIVNTDEKSLHEMLRIRKDLLNR